MYQNSTTKWSLRGTRQCKCCGNLIDQGTSKVIASSIVNGPINLLITPRKDHITISCRTLMPRYPHKTQKVSFLRRQEYRFIDSGHFSNPDPRLRGDDKEGAEYHA